MSDGRKKLARQAGKTLVLRVLSAGALILFFALASRNLEQQESGLFFLSFVGISILSAASSLGLNRVMVRLLAGHDQVQEGLFRGSVITTGLLWSLMAAVVVSIALFLSADLLATLLFHKERLADVLAVMALSIVPVTLYLACGNILEGQNKPMMAVLVQNFVAPAGSLLVGGVFLLWQGIHDAGQMAWFFLCGNLLAMGVGLWLVRKYQQKGRNRAAEYVHRISASELLQPAMPLLLVLMMNHAMRWSGQVTTGIWLPAGEVAALAVAHRTAASLGLILQSVSRVVSPKFAALHKQAGHDGIWPLLMQSMRLSTLYALPVFLGICLLSPWLMGFFGKGYEDYWLILVILSIGYFVNAVTGPIAQLLVMVEQEKLLRNITILTGLFAMVAAMLLTAWWGLLGSALATGVVLVIQNLVVLGHVSRLYRGKSAPVCV